MVVNALNEIAVVLEIKFVPQGYPVFEGDIAKLRAIAVDGKGSTHKLMLNPDTGEYCGVETKISDGCVLSFAAIGRHDAKAIDEHDLTNAFCLGGCEALKDRFIPLVKCTNPPR